jgi:hypothetical protein
MAQIFLKWRGILASNLGRALEIGRLGGFFSDSTGQATQGSGRHHVQQHGGAQARATVHQKRWCFSPTWSRLWEELVLPIYNGETGPQKAVDREAARTVVRSSSGDAPTSWSSPTCSSWPPLASRSVQWFQSVMNSLNLVAVRVRRVSGLAGKNPTNTGHYLWGFLILLVEETESYDFYLQAELRFGFVWEIFGRGWILGLLWYFKPNSRPG